MRNGWLQRLGSRARRVLARRRNRIAILIGIVVALLLAGATMVYMPGNSYRGPLPPLTAAEGALERDLRTDVEKLAVEIGERYVGRTDALIAAAEWLEQTLRDHGYTPSRQEYDCQGIKVWNIEVEIPAAARTDEILVVGAHYDSIPDCPAANDNGSGVAALLALARAYAPGGSGATSSSAALADRQADTTSPQIAVRPPGRTLRLVFFTNEEPPWFQTPLMGSWVYARRCRERKENVIGMISLETLGYYSDQADSQAYPSPLLKLVYPSTGNFVAFVGGLQSRGWIRRCVGAFRRTAQFPSEGAAIPDAIPGVGWSDHWSFASHDYPAFMLTDTAPFRYPHYHESTDTPDKIDFDRLARVTAGTIRMVDELVR